MRRQCCDPFGGFSAETCDGLDNDCNGAPDDGIVPVPTTCGVGECTGNTGEETCVGGGLVDSCDPTAGSTEEVCDGLDNDCDGEADDGLDADGDEIADCFDLCPFDPDNDADEVCGDVDFCAGTVIPESVPTVELKPNRWALVDDDLEFDTVTKGKGKGPGRSYDTTDTGGCSCEQIIEAQDLGQGHTKHGCSISAMDDWVDIVNSP